MSRMRVLISAIIACVMIVTVSGCAFGTRRPTLDYSAVTPVKAQKNIAIKVTIFKDERPDKNIVGNVRNGWGLKTADVITETSVSEWVTNALKSELKNDGYTVVDTSAENEIGGEVIKVYCDSYMCYEGEVMMKVSLKKSTNVLFEKTYSGKASDLNWAATAKSYGTILQRSLQQIMIQVVGDVDRALQH